MAEKKNFHRIQVDKSMLTCALCWKMYNEPKTLTQCGHTFCKRCLMGLADFSQKSQIDCPTCGEATPLPEGGVAVLRSNAYVRYLVEQVMSQRMEDLCENCTQSAATVRCTICVTKLCGECADSHMADTSTVHDLAFLLEDPDPQKQTLEDISHHDTSQNTFFSNLVTVFVVLYLVF